MTSSKRSRIDALPAELRAQLKRQAGRPGRPCGRHPARRSGRAAAAVVRPAAAVVPRPAAARGRPSTTAPSRCGWPARSTCRRWRRRWPGWSPGTSRCAPRSRTCDGVAVQVVHAPLDVPLPVVDAHAGRSSTHGAARRVRRSRSTCAGPAAAGAAGPRAPRTTTCCCSTAHHIVTDGWSMGMLTRRAGRLYGRGAVAPAELPAGRAVPGLRRVAARPARRRRDGRAAGRTGRRQLAGVPPLELPTDRPRPGGADLGRRRPRLHRPGRRDRRAARAGPRAGHHAVHRARRGLPGAASPAGPGRRTSPSAPSSPAVTAPELERVVGFFVNTVVLRSTVDDRRPFGDLLDTVADTVAGRVRARRGAVRAGRGGAAAASARPAATRCST